MHATKPRRVKHTLLDQSGETSLKIAIAEIYDRDTSLAVIRMLLRAGASLDCDKRGGKFITAEDIMSGCYDDEEEENDEAVVAIKALIAGVRKYGTYKRYMRAPHREFLAVRGLAQRGKLAVQLAITARAARENPALNFIARLGDNGVCWHILSFWRETN